MAVGPSLVGDCRSLTVWACCGAQAFKLNGIGAPKFSFSHEEPSQVDELANKIKAMKRKPPRSIPSHGVRKEKS